ncbi:MAG: ATP-dependent protease LonB [Thermoplasmata archaeon]|nr:ATP-dependent protease LonB [Thermoplasmata archaeon]
MELTEPGEDILPVEEWVNGLTIQTTANVDVPESVIEQVIGQEEGVDVIRKAAAQRRHVLLIGDPGTGKSMLGQAMAELLPNRELEDILAYPNTDDANEPKIRVVPAGKGKQIVKAQRTEARLFREQKARMKWFLIILVVAMGFILFALFGDPYLLLISFVIVAMLFLAFRTPYGKRDDEMVPKLLVSHNPEDSPPFIDATGAHAGALLGDVRHDPFQSGGLETAPHLRVESGAIHKAHKGVLFVDEINLLRTESQQSILTAMQEKRFPIVGQSERSAGAMVKTERVPCDFILVAAGNLDSLYPKDPFKQGMHPALRSRIRGYGYEIYMRNHMPDTHENRLKLVRFVAQEITKDGKIPHFDRTALAVVLREAQKRSGKRGHLTLRLRELGGLIRTAGDLATERKAKIVKAKHVLDAREFARTLEQQIHDRSAEEMAIYKTYLREGVAVGRVNGLAVLSGEEGVSVPTGLVLPLVAEVTPAASKEEGKTIATGRLGDIANEAVQNVSAIIKKETGENIRNFDIHIQFINTYSGVEGDSASISVATAVISAIEGLPVDQSIAMTGSLSVKGDVLPVGGVSAKIEAAIKAGMMTVIIPRANMQEVFLDDMPEGFRVVPVETIKDVIDIALVGDAKKGLLTRLTRLLDVKDVVRDPLKGPPPVPTDGA